MRAAERQLADGDPQIRVAAFRALRSAKPSILAEARRLAADPSPAVRREVALAMRGTPFDQSRDILMALATGFDGKDRWYLEALGTAATGNESALYSALLSSLPSRSPLDWNERFAAIAWRLHPVAAVDALAARAAAPQLSAEARQQALVALGFINDASAAQAMARLTQQPGPRSGGAGRLVDDLSQDERLAFLPRRRLDHDRGRRDPGRQRPKWSGIGRWCWTMPHPSIAGSMRRWRWQQIRLGRSS